MAKTIGVTLSERVRAGLVVDYKLAAPLHCFPEELDEDDALIELPTDSLVRTLCEQVGCGGGEARGHRSGGRRAAGLDSQRRGGGGSESSAVEGRRASRR